MEPTPSRFSFHKSSWHRHPGVRSGDQLTLGKGDQGLVYRAA